MPYCKATRSVEKIEGIRSLDSSLMPATQVAVVVGDGEEIVDIALRRGGPRRTSFVEQGRRQIAREVESRQRELHLGFDLEGIEGGQLDSRDGGTIERTLSLKGPWNEKRLR